MAASTASAVKSVCIWPCPAWHSVHEMARDEARHGKAFKGLLDRYFGKEIAREKRAAAAAEKNA